MPKLYQSENIARLACVALAATVLLFAQSCQRPGMSLPVVEAGTGASTGVTEIVVGDQAVQTDVKRFGINLGGQNFYDSGQLLKNLLGNNPGFEGETWQTILRCAGVSETTCTDGNQWNQWPKDFLKDATFQVISGPAAGTVGTVLESTAANSALTDSGVGIRFAPLKRALEIDNFVIVRKAMPGNPQAGWWTSSWGGGNFSAETKDLSPRTVGKQAIRLSAPRPEMGATLSGYFDSLKGRSFVQLHGRYRLQFRAKGVLGDKKIQVTVDRQVEGAPESMLKKDVQLTDGWNEYSLEFTANETGASVGTVAVSFMVKGAEVLMDDVSLEKAEHDPGNPTVYRDEVVAALKELKPGILRYQDGGELGSSIDNLLAAPGAAQRAGWSHGGKEQGAVPVGLPEFLELCKVVGAEPWFTLPAATSPLEMKSLVEFLGGPVSTPYGAKRAARGQREPWTTVFPKIHLELGNEMWNGTTFAGAAIADPVIYGLRAKDVFLAARSAPSYQPAKFDLVIGSFVLIPDWTKKELAASGGYDTASVAGYLYSELNDASTDEAVFGPMFAEPEMMDGPKGLMAKQLAVAKAAGVKLSIYEENTGTTKGAATQEEVDRTVPSVGAGVALVDHMLLQLRDLGMKDQSVWALGGFSNGFDNPETHAQESTPLYGTVVDMGGATNRKRPQFLAEALVNGAILPKMVRTEVRGANPVWNQEKSSNAGGVELSGAHEVQSFAFTDGKKHSLIVVNLSRKDARPMRFSGVNGPKGNVTVKTLGAAKITDGNEKQELVKVKSAAYEAGKTWNAPPYSVTVMEWE